jgi:hypothetical protein
MGIKEQCFSTAGPQSGTGLWHSLGWSPHLIKKKHSQAAVSERLKTTVTEESTAYVFRDEDGCNRIHQNVDIFPLDYMASNPRRAYS